MPSNIRGITVEIGGNTGPLTTALKDVNKTSRDLNAELKQVNKALKLDPTNTVLVGQKQKILAEQIANTKEKLDRLKEAERQAKAQFENGDLGEEKYRALQREVINTENELKNLEAQAKESAGAMGVRIQETGKKMQKSGEHITEVGKKFLPATAAVVGMGVAAVKTGNDFEKQMSRVAGVADATGSDLDKLKEQAKQLGADTAYSATEAAEGMENLASAGFDANEIMAAMPGMLDLAASSGEDLAGSADIAASTLRGFGLAASDAGHVADVLAKNAADTNAAVMDTGEAMKYIAPVAKSAGWSLESVTAAIGTMADAGIKGSQAGTILRGAMTRLMKPSKNAAEAMKSIGFNAYDSSGKMKPLSTITDELKTKTSKLSDEQRDNVIATIMGQEALSGMNVLMDAGKPKLDGLTKGLENSDGAAKKMADTMQDNTSGAIEEMGGAIETAAISIQEILAPIITEIVEKITLLVNKFSSLDEGTKKTILTVLGIVAALGPVLILLGKLTSGIGAIVQGIGFLMTPAGQIILIVAGIVAAVTGLIALIKHLWETNETFREIVTRVWDGVKNVVGTVVNALVTFFTVTIPEAWDGLVAFFQGIPEWWNGLWSGIGDFFTNTWNKITTFITQKIPEIINNIGKWFNELPYKLGYALGAAAGKIASWCVNTFNTVKKEIPKIINNIGNWFKELPGKIWTHLVNAVDKVKQWCTNLMNTIRTQIPLLINRIGTFFSQLPGKIWTHLSNAASKVGQWCSKLIQTAATEIPKFVSKVVHFMGELPKKMLDIGGNIIKGIWQGISNSVGWLGRKVKDFCTGVVDGFKKNLKIHSPSDILADQVGKFMALGIGQGFTDNMKKVTKTMTDAIPTEFDTDTRVQTAMVVTGSGIKVPPAPGAAQDLGSVLSLLREGLSQLSDMQVVLDSGAVVGGIAPGLDAEFGNLHAGRVRGRT